MLWRWRKPLCDCGQVKTEPGEVTIVQFSDEGKRLKKVKIAKVSKDGGGMAETAFSRGV